jgi:hypothetical protein
MNEQMLEILISKYIDSEITPAEQKMLDAELQSNPEACETLKALEQLRDQSQQMLKEEVVLSGAPASTIIEQALAQSDRPGKQKGTAYRPWYRDPISLAACFMLGFGFISFWVHYGDTGNPNMKPNVGGSTAGPVLPPKPQPPKTIEQAKDRPLIPHAKGALVITFEDPVTGKVRAIELHRKSDIKTVTYDEGL